MKNAKAYVAALIVAGLGSPVLHASENHGGWRIGASGLFGKFKFDDRSIDDNAVGVRVFGEYRVNHWLGLEASFMNTGRFEDRTPAGTARLSLEGFSGGIVAYAPAFGEVELFGKVGYFSLDQDLRVGDTFQSRRTGGLVAGAGGRVNITEHVGVRLEYDWYDIKGGDLSTIGVGIDYRF